MPIGKREMISRAQSIRIKRPYIRKTLKYFPSLLLDALASLDFNLSVTESVGKPFFKFSDNQ